MREIIVADLGAERGFSKAGKQEVNVNKPVRPQIYNTRKKGTTEKGNEGEEMERGEER